MTGESCLFIDTHFNRSYRPWNVVKDTDMTVVDMKPLLTFPPARSIVTETAISDVHHKGN
jgi:hypothetical protein